jgi:hypothetical protein
MLELRHGGDGRSSLSLIERKNPRLARELYVWLSMQSAKLMRPRGKTRVLGRIWHYP